MNMDGLTDTEIRSAKATEKAYSMGDGGGLPASEGPEKTEEPLQSVDILDVFFQHGQDSIAVELGVPGKFYASGDETNW
jgi:hypothetical protein